MKCIECGSEMSPEKLQTLAYESIGLPNVYITIPVRECPNCGEVEHVVPNMPGLHRLVASELIRKKNRLTRDEVRFLRKHLGYSAHDFSEIIGIPETSINNFENGTERVPPHYDKAIRVMIAKFAPVDAYEIETLRSVDEDSEEPLTVKLEAHDRDWQRELVA